ncbi:MAG: hypothetical protein WDZ62_00085 [Candidatus Pacearchaeota archaeon]
MVDKNKAIITGLSIAVVILALIVVYVFVLQPTITGNAIERQQEGFNIAIIQIGQLAAQCQPIPVPLETGENQTQTINLVAMECFPDRFPELNQQQSTDGSQVIEGSE